MTADKPLTRPVKFPSSSNNYKEKKTSFISSSISVFTSDVTSAGDLGGHDPFSEAGEEGEEDDYDFAVSPVELRRPVPLEKSAEKSSGVKRALWASTSPKPAAVGLGLKFQEANPSDFVVDSDSETFEAPLPKQKPKPRQKPKQRKKKLQEGEEEEEKVVKDEKDEKEYEREEKKEKEKEKKTRKRKVKEEDETPTTVKRKPGRPPKSEKAGRPPKSEKVIAAAKTATRPSQQRLSLKTKKPLHEKVCYIVPGRHWDVEALARRRPHELDLDRMWALKSAQQTEQSEPHAKRRHPFLLRNFKATETAPILTLEAPTPSGLKSETQDDDYEEYDFSSDNDDGRPQKKRRLSKSSSAGPKTKKGEPQGLRQLTRRLPLTLKVVKQVSEEAAATMKHSGVHKGFPTNKAIILLAFANIPGSEEGLSVKQMGMYAQAQRAISDKYDGLSRWRRVIGQTLPSYPLDFCLQEGLWVWLTQKAFELGTSADHKEFRELKRSERFADEPEPEPEPELELHDALSEQESSPGRPSRSGVISSPFSFKPFKQQKGAVVSED